MAQASQSSKPSGGAGRPVAEGRLPELAQGAGIGGIEDELDPGAHGVLLQAGRVGGREVTVEPGTTSTTTVARVEVVVRLVVDALVDAELDIGRAAGSRVLGEGDGARRIDDPIVGAVEDEQRQAPVAGMRLGPGQRVRASRPSPERTGGGG